MTALETIPFKAMGSPCALHLYAAPGVDVHAVADRCVSEVGRLECKYSRYRDDSVTSRINASAGQPKGVEVDSETAALLDYAEIVYGQSGGLFDVTSGIYRKAWDYRSGRLPDAETLEQVRRRVGWRKLSWSTPRIVLPIQGMELDFGGYVKEYAVDRVVDLARTLGIARGLVDLGGDLGVIGAHPGDEPWVVGIRHPRKPEAAMAKIELRTGAIASSGDYERFMVVDGVRYGHILDPRTGWPVRGLASVSVVASHCLIAGSASTVAVLKGRRDGARWLDDLGLPNLRMDSEGRLGGSLNDASVASPRADAALEQSTAGAARGPAREVEHLRAH